LQIAAFDARQHTVTVMGRCRFSSISPVFGIFLFWMAISLALCLCYAIAPEGVLNAAYKM